jgi:hypothetical protein
MKKLKVLLACEESQEVCKAFRAKGHEAYSCDIIECSGGYLEFHLKMDIFKAIKLMDWDIMIAFPPCTHLTVSGNKWFKPEFRDRFPDKPKQRESAIKFVKDLYNCSIPKVAIENPIGVLSSMWQKPDQIIQPYYFGDPHPKSTCLWLKGLPKLFHAKESDLFARKTHVDPEYIIGKRDGKKYSKIHYMSVSDVDSAKLRSKTFPGIAKAMADQWG